MTENRTHDDILEEMLLEDPELAEAYQADRPAYLVARELIKARRLQGLSQAEVAELVGKPASVISRIERMDTTPTLRTANDLARALGLTLELQFVPSGVEETGTPRIFISHGTKDQILPIDTCSRRLVPHLKHTGYEVKFQEFDGPHAMAPEIAREAIEWFLK